MAVMSKVLRAYLVSKVRMPRSQSMTRLLPCAKNVFGGHQQVFDGGGHAPFEQHRLVGLADRVQQVIILHVARANLQHVGVNGHQGHLAGGHDFGDNRQAGRLAGFGQQFEAVLAHALKSVG